MEEASLGIPDQSLGFKGRSAAFPVLYRLYNNCLTNENYLWRIWYQRLVIRELMNFNILEL